MKRNCASHHAGYECKNTGERRGYGVSLRQTSYTKKRSSSNFERGPRISCSLHPCLRKRQRTRDSKMMYGYSPLLPWGQDIESVHRESRFNNFRGKDSKILNIQDNFSSFPINPDGISVLRSPTPQIRKTRILDREALLFYVFSSFT